MKSRLSTLSPLLATTAASADTRYDFNPDWRLFVGDAKGADAPAFDDSAWKPVTLPRPWNEDDAFAKDVRDLRTGVAWYRRLLEDLR